MQPEESLEKIGYGKEIWKLKVAERREEDKEQNGGQISYRDSKKRLRGVEETKWDRYFRGTNKNKS